MKIIKKLKLGKFVYNYFYAPSLNFRYHITHFGVVGWYKYKIGEKEMKTKAKSLKINIKHNHKESITINFLTGKNYWHQTIFGIYSFIKSHNNNVKVNIFSDGTIDEETKGIFLNFCAEIEILDEKEVVRRLNVILPKERFPTLNYLRNWHPFFRRLIDIHILAEGWAVHLDSDMLFFNYPTEFLSKANKKESFYMFEKLEESFFVDTPKNLLEIHKIGVKEKVNGGVIAYNSSLVDYQDLEQKASLLLNEYKDTVPAKVEQTLMSYILYQQNAIPLNSEEYHIFYDKEISQKSKPSLCHYIFKAKAPYFTSEWKKIIN